ncbi:MAG: hypothetical protein DHS80DRAFT_30481 [Piptocephalis tieghemiana]|nr:MAG: hypothetical protein DHS80DRAFT_30481 [Piptocephalis tieghemiana]
MTVSSEYKVGQRIRTGTYTATIRYIGAVPPTEGIWLGVEWDEAERGKHSGTHQGQVYFTTRISGSGSFIRPSSITDHPISLMEAAWEKYIGGPFKETDPALVETRAQRNLEDSTIQLGGDGVDVETVGWEKIAKKQANLEALEEVSLTDGAIGYADPPSSNRIQLKGVKDLDLSGNLIPSLHTVSEMAQPLERLSILRLNRNRMEFPESSLDLVQGAFASVTVLSLVKTMSSLEEFSRVQDAFPKLQELYLDGNNLKRIWSKDTIPAGLFSSLKHLSLQRNCLSTWSTIAPLASLPSLTKLDLLGNGLTEVYPTPSPGFSNLSSLTLSHNAIADWSSVDNLTSLPSLTSLRILDNPVVVPRKESSDPRFETIGRVGSLALLNGSSISPEERANAERWYLLQIVKAIPQLDSRLEKHPRYTSLCEVHGEPEVAPSYKTSDRLKDRLLNVDISLREATLDGDNVKTVQKRLLGKSLPSTTGAQDEDNKRKSTIRVLLNSLRRVWTLGPRKTVRLYLEVTTLDNEKRHVEMEQESRELSFYGVENGSTIIALMMD